MTRLAGNMRFRLLAVLMLLALRPCVIFVTAQFVSSQSGRQARIEYIDDELAVQHVAVNRRVFVVPAHATATSPPLASGPCAIALSNQGRPSDLEPAPSRIAANLASLFGSRAAPL